MKYADNAFFGLTLAASLAGRFFGDAVGGAAFAVVDFGAGDGGSGDFFGGDAGAGLFVVATAVFVVAGFGDLTVIKVEGCDTQTQGCKLYV
jgi:hypothetical protein